MNEAKMISILSNLDDDLVDKEIDFLMGDIECDVESINTKAHQKLKKHQRKNKLRRRLPYAAAVLICLISINAVYAGEISQAIKKFFNKTPVYSTIVEGKAYYLAKPLVLDDNLTIDSFLAAEGNVEMVCTSKLKPEVLGAMTIIPKESPGVQYNIGVYEKDDEDTYRFTFADCKEQNFNLKPFQEFDLLVGDKKYAITLSEARSLDNNQNITTGQPVNPTDLVTVGANSIEKNGKQAVQLIASFKNEDIKLFQFGQLAPGPYKSTFKNLGKEGQLGFSSGPDTEDIYATDASGAKHKLTAPADAQIRPITTFETDAATGSPLTINLSALQAIYEKTVANIRFDIPPDGEVPLDKDVDMVAQRAVIKSIKRLSPTTCVLIFQLNTGADHYVSISQFVLSSNDVKKISAAVNNDQAVVTVEFDADANAFNMEIACPVFVVNGNWNINLN